MSPPAPSGLERALFGGAGTAEIDRWVAGAVREALGVAVIAVLFRAGRIDAVYGVRLADGRDAVVKVHRPPADPEALAATGKVLDLLASADYPCPQLLGAPIARDGRVATVQSFLTGGLPADASRPAVRRALAASLAEQVDVLR
ncbi:MAG: phosphotransferase, partial [Pseudonocardiales bacterium]|nr:phosphotransferase [Pseudonocardiales bacterium]